MKKTITIIILSILLSLSLLVHAFAYNYYRNLLKDKEILEGKGASSLEQCETTKTNLEENNKILEKQNETLLATAENCGTQTLPFANDTLGFSFEYPSSYGKLEFGIRKGSEPDENGNSGEKFEGRFSNKPLYFGGVTDDFREGRSSTFTDMDEEMFKLFKDDISETLEINGETVYLVIGKQETPIPGATLDKGEYGAIIKLKGEKFKYLAIATWVNSDEPQNAISLEEFKKILQSVKIY